MARDPYKYFRIEAAEIVDGLGRGLMDLEKRADAELVARVLRHAHTLKGAARIVKHHELADLAHALEDVLAPLREAPVAHQQTAALAMVDRMSAAVAALPAPEVREVAKPATVVEPAPMRAADTAGLDEILGGLGELHGLVARLRGGADPAAIVDQLGRELGGVRHDVERLRLVPASNLFTTLERVARDAALATGKPVTFVAKGGDIRVDAPVLASLHAAVVQLVRNAVAHGIESPAERAARGKPVEGRVAIAVRLAGRRVAVSCEDDGGGIAVDEVRRVAIRRGDESAKTLDHDGIVALLLRGGLTTRTNVTELAGRGIGLDVVSGVAAELGGEVTASTRSGIGTTIAITVPITMAAISALMVEAGDRTAAIPLDAIRRVVKLRPGDVTYGAGRVTVPFDDLAIAYAPLARVLGTQAAEASSIVVVESAEAGLAALGVDRLRAVDEVVLRALPFGVPIDPIVWGVTLDDAGFPRTVLDPTALVAAAQRIVDRPVAVPPRALPILVVDDSLTTRMLEKSILESSGYTVELASSAEEALVKVEGRAFGLILVDVEMPGMDGFAFITELRSRPRIANIPAILVTSRNAPEDHRRGAEVGAQGYVVKGEFDQVQLVTMIRRLVRT